MPEKFVYQKKERTQKQQEDQVNLLIGTGLLLGALGIAYAIGQTIGSNIQPIKQSLKGISNFLLVQFPNHFIQYEFYRIIGLISISLILIGIFRELDEHLEDKAILAIPIFCWFMSTILILSA